MSSWPQRCLIENVAVHPTEPWLAVAATDSEGERGAVMVIDAQTAALRSVATREGLVGWSDPGLLRWHPDGRRIATNVETNGIALLDGEQWIGSAFPDDTRDGGVRYVWVDDRMFTDTDHFFEITPGDPCFDFSSLDGPALADIEWNAHIGAAVGRVETGIAAFDPRRRAVLYENPLHEQSGTPRFSPDGRWCVCLQKAVHPASDELLFFNADDGAIHGTRRPSSPRIDELVWGPRGALAVRSHVHNIGGPPSDARVDLFVGGEVQTTIDLGPRRVQTSHGAADTSGMTWSPDGGGIALLLDGGEVAVYDASTGKPLSSFAARAPAIPVGLPDYYRNGHRPAPGDLVWVPGQRLVRIAPHFISAWTLDGQRLAELIAPA